VQVVTLTKIVVPALALVLPTFLAAQPPAVTTSPERLVNGSAFAVRVSPSAGEALPGWRSLGAELDGRRLTFERNADGTWSALGGVDFDAKPGPHPLVLGAVREDGAAETFTVPLEVAHETRPTSRLTVPKRFIEPNARTRARIERERALKASLLSASSPKSLFEGRFAPPLANATSEGYGMERLFNGKRQSVHYGLDYRAAKGTPVAAMNAGRVLLARDLFYEGRCVAIDHGHGLVTLYLHFSKLEVKEGDRVVRGQRLGLSGASGRVTGPHLHVAVRWQGLYLDPATLLALEP